MGLLILYFSAFFPLKSLTKTSIVFVDRYYSFTIVWVNSSFCHSYNTNKQKQNKAKSLL